MNIEDINNILAEISKLKNQGIELSDGLDSEKILSDYEIINEQSKRGRFTLAREYFFIKRLQHTINENLYHNDANAFIGLFTAVEIIRKKLGRVYERRREISSKIKNIRRIIDENSGEKLEIASQLQ